MSGLTIIRNSKKIVDRSSNSRQVNFNNLKIISIRTSFMCLPIRQGNTLIKPIESCMICHGKTDIQTFKCSHIFCMICLDELYKARCPRCNCDIRDELNQVQIELISLRG